MAIDLSQFHQTFYEESLEGLDVMEQSLLDLDCDTVDSETINTIFRAAHSIKGGSGTFGFVHVAEFTHVLETLLDEIRNGKRTLVPLHVDLLLRSVDCLRNMLNGLKGGEANSPAEAIELKVEFEKILKNVVVDLKVTQPTAEKPPEVSLLKNVWRVNFKPSLDMLQSGNEPSRMLRELCSLGDAQVICNTSRVPEFSALNPEQCFLEWEVTLSGDISEAAIREVFEWVEDDAEISISQIKESETEAELPTLAQVSEAVDQLMAQQPLEVKENTPATKTDPVKKDPARSSVETSSIRVGIDKIDNLVNLVGELVITQSMLGQLGNEFDMSRIAKLQEGLAQLEHNTRELQESVMRIRMLPISFAFNRFPRMVRDLSQKLQKKVELKLMGENTELDKTVMEKIGDPLVHLVRNSLDHGVETPEERAEAGKPETGTVTLNAFHQGGNIVIEVIDDGKGLNPEKILAKARQKGLITSTENLTAEQINDLIFLPGFSTAAEVTDISGRGVGMDVVRRNIQELNGSVEVKSVPGKGSTFSIRLPLTLAILDGQLIRVGDDTYIVPLVSIIESMQIKSQLVNHVAGGCDVFRLRNEYIPIISLHDVLGSQNRSQNIEECLLVVVEWANEKVGMVVDDLLAQQQVVIKSLENNYQRVDGISGATILGDGTVSLIVDVQGIVRMAGQRHLDKTNSMNLKSEQAA